MVIIKVVGEMLFLFGLLAWLYGVEIQFVGPPNWQFMPISRLLKVRTDTFTIIMFLVSVLGFFLWRLTTEFLKAEQQRKID